jgi:adenylate cyclase
MSATIPAPEAPRTMTPWLKVRRWLRPLLTVGVPPGSTRSQERELVTGNLVVLLSILVTVPDIFNFYSFHTEAGRLAALWAAIASTLYCGCFALLALGRRWLGICIFTNTVLWVLTANVILIGTDVGNQYYFVIVGVGVAFVWPRSFAYMRYLHAVVGLLLLITVVVIARPYPAIGAALPEATTLPLRLVHASSAYIIAIGFVIYSLTLGERAEGALLAERAKSEALLLNVLPEAIASRLKEDTRIIADHFESVTVLFADVVNFTELSAALSPEEVVAFLNQVFSRFDALTEKYGLEKIKTIGDAYMVAGGIPVPREDHAAVVAEVALEMSEIARAMVTPACQPLLLRIGLHTGPAVAGVIGTKKFSYDLWGDTVNTASRMESHGISGEIQVTPQTRALLGDRYEFESRGTVEVKGKGPMPLYLLRGRKPAAG